MKLWVLFLLLCMVVGLECADNSPTSPLERKKERSGLVKNAITVGVTVCILGLLQSQVLVGLCNRASNFLLSSINALNERFVYPEQNIPLSALYYKLTDAIEAPVMKLSVTGRFIEATKMSALFALAYRIVNTIGLPRAFPHLGHLVTFVYGFAMSVVAYGPQVYVHFVGFAGLVVTLILARIVSFARPLHMLVTLVGSLAQLVFFLCVRVKTQTVQNDANHATGQMLVCLRHISVIVDAYDALSDPSILSTPNTKLYNAIGVSFGDLVPLLGYTFAPFLYLSGPILPYKEYKAYIEGKGVETAITARHFAQFVATGILAGGSYYVNTKLEQHYPLSALRNDTFVNSSNPFYLAFIYNPLSVFGGIFQLYAVWSIGEMIGILGGIQFTEKDSPASVEARFKHGCEYFFPKNPILTTNVYPIISLLSSNLLDAMNCWNTQVNSWAQYYVLKRIGTPKSSKDAAPRESRTSLGKVFSLGQKLILNPLAKPSMFLFLALWHGTHSGYFYTFSFGIISQMLKEFQVTDYIDNAEGFLPRIHFQATGMSLVHPLVYLVLYVPQLLFFRFVIMNVSLSFFLLDLNVWSKVMDRISWFPLRIYQLSVLIGLVVHLHGAGKFEEAEVRECRKCIHSFSGGVADSLSGAFSRGHKMGSRVLGGLRSKGRALCSRKEKHHNN